MLRRRPSRVIAVTAMISLALGACTSDAGETPAPAEQSPRPAAKPVTAADFAEWRAAFLPRARAAGISEATLAAAFDGVMLNERVLELDKRQPEFTRPIWEYLDSAVSAQRIATGREHAAAKRAVLDRIEAQYGVDAEVVLAIWGIESAYGANFGNIPVVESMATLAFDGRRREFAEEQLVAALRILQAGEVTPGRMIGSWAGAMGHTQFIPTSYLQYAVDFTGDGRRDLWADDAVDALASTANYLAGFGWERGAPKIVEVTLPDGFDFTLADDTTRRTAAEWAALGIRTGGGALPEGQSITLILPAGARGPAFAAYPNFRVIKRYNNSTSYALAVAHLADRIAGASGITRAWPREDRPLSRTEKQELQRRLTGLGYDTQGVDGIIGPNSRAAVRRFQLARGLLPDGYVSAKLLDEVRSAGG